jgi:cytochrome P450
MDTVAKLNAIDSLERARIESQRLNTPYFTTSRLCLQVVQFIF